MELYYIECRVISNVNKAVNSVKYRLGSNFIAWSPTHIIIVMVIRVTRNAFTFNIKYQYITSFTNETSHSKTANIFYFNLYEKYTTHSWQNQKSQRVIWKQPFVFHRNSTSFTSIAGIVGYIRDGENGKIILGRFHFFQHDEAAHNFYYLLSFLGKIIF